VPSFMIQQSENCATNPTLSGWLADGRRSRHPGPGRGQIGGRARAVIASAVAQGSSMIRPGPAVARVHAARPELCLQGLLTPEAPLSYTSRTACVMVTPRPRVTMSRDR
jgi:hypothetical protein